MELFQLKLMIAICLLLLCCSYATAKNSVPISKDHIHLQNWKQISGSDWPPVESEATSEDRFYFVQGDVNQFSEDNPFLKLKENYFENVTNLANDNSKAQFKYWSNSKATHFKSTIDRSKHYYLNTEHQWAPLSPVNINRYQWPRYEFYNDQKFTLALKEIKVQYIDEKPDTKKLKKSPFTAFNNEPQRLTNVVEIDPNSVDFAYTGQKVEDTVQVYDYFSHFILSKNFSALQWTLIEFDFKMRQSNTVYQVKLENKIVERDSTKFYYKVTANFSNDDVSIHFFHDLETNSYQLFVNIFQNFGFALYNTFIDKKIYNPRALLIPNSYNNSESNFKTYKFQSSPGAISLVYQSTNIYQCLTLFKSSLETIIDVYFTFEGDMQGKKLFTFGKGENLTKGLQCVQDYIYLQNFGNYQLTFVITEKNNNLNGDKLITLKWKTNNFVNPAAYLSGSLSIPENSLISDFYWRVNNNKLFDYTFIGHANLAPVFACDIINNCFPFEQIHLLGNGSKAKYGLSKEIKNYFQHSPLIRLFCNDQNAKIEYFSANEASLALLQQHLSSTSHTNILHNITTEEFSQLYYTVAIPEQTPTKLELPLETVDLRAQILTLSVATDSTHQIRLLGLQLDDASNGLSNLYLNYGQVMKISTNEIFNLLPHEMEGPKNAKKLTLFFELQERNSAVHPTADVDIHVNYTIYAKETNEHFTPKTLGTLPLLEEFPNDQSVRTTKLDHHNSQIFLLSLWTENNSQFGAQSLKTHLRFTALNGKELTSKKLNVSRNIVGSFDNGQHFSSTPMTVNINGHLASLIDNFEDGGNITIGRPFRYGYLIEWHDTEGGELVVEIEDNYKMFGPNTKKCTTTSPSFAGINCHDVLNYQCPPYYFSYNSTTKKCTRANELPQYFEESCDAAQGCANLFDRPLMSASIYSTSNTSSSFYFPVTVSTKNQYLKIDRKTQSPPISSFCVQFDYVASHMKLLVSDSPPEGTSGSSKNDRNLIAFEHKDGHWFRDQFVCASQLNENQEKVEALYFSFEVSTENEHQSNFNIESHMVANLQYILE